MIRVYRYGLLPPTENADEIRQQMRASHAYRNTLTEIERGRRAAVREIERAAGDIPALDAAAMAADAAVSAAILEIKAARSASRSRAETEPMRARVAAARDQKKAANGALRAARLAVRQDPAIVSAMDAVNERAAELRRGARACCGVYWGTYLLVEDADQAARKAPLYNGAEPNDPRFLRFSGEGRIGVQIQNGMSVHEVTGETDTRLRIVRGRARVPTSLPSMPPDKAARVAAHRARNHARRVDRDDGRTELWLRVGSDGRAPVWGRWPMIMHRELPSGAVIKRAVVRLRHCGPREEWSVCITVEAPDAVVDDARSGAVALDVGWRQMGDEIRVATWEATDGATGELRLPARLLGGFAKAEDLRSIRDKNFNDARIRLAASLDLLPTIPDWLREATAHLAQWRAPGRLARLARRWGANRFDGDAAAYDPVEAWRYHDRHLWAWESSQRASSLRYRRELYRTFAADLASRYETIVLEAFDLRVFAVAPHPEVAKAENETARGNRHTASVSELRLSLKSAAVARGSHVSNVDPVDSTRTCHACGHINRFDAASHVTHGCTGCGAIWDQDANAAAVLLARWIERLSDAPGTGGARKAENTSDLAPVGESRWARAKRMRAEKLARQCTARNEEAKCAN